jgi:two-component system response regulator MprA
MNIRRPIILVVDDDYHVRSLVTDLLELEGYAVRTVAEGGAGLTLLRSERPDVVLADLMLADMSGLEFCERLRAQCGPRLPIILYSAASGSCWKTRSISAGADDYLAKPFDVDDLLERVRSRLLVGAETVAR